MRSVSQSQSAEKTLSTFNKLIGYVSLAIVFILLAVAFFLISNTITMGISVRQEEIGIMKLIGATDFFVRAPFVIEGILLGIVGAAIPMGILYVLYNKVIEFVMTRFHLLSGFLQFLDVSHVFRILLPVGVGLGIGIGFIGSMMSVRKHFKGYNFIKYRRDAAEQMLPPRWREDCLAVSPFYFECGKELKKWTERNISKGFCWVFSVRC